MPPFVAKKPSPKTAPVTAPKATLTTTYALPVDPVNRTLMTRGDNAAPAPTAMAISNPVSTAESKAYPLTCDRERMPASSLTTRGASPGVAEM